MNLVFLIMLALSFKLASAESVNYYKCTTERGVNFSQVPCNSNSMSQKLEHHSPELAVPEAQHAKQLNQLERKQIIRTLERKIIANKHKVAVLDRDTEQLRKAILSKLNQVPNDRTAQRRLARNVKRELQEIEKAYVKELKDINKETTDLERKLKKFSK